MSKDFTISSFVSFKCKIAKDIYIEEKNASKAKDVLRNMVDEFRNMECEPEFEDWTQIIDTLELLNTLYCSDLVDALTER